MEKSHGNNVDEKCSQNTEYVPRGGRSLENAMKMEDNSLILGRRKNILILIYPRTSKRRRLRVRNSVNGLGVVRSRVHVRNVALVL